MLQVCLVGDCESTCIVAECAPVIIAEYLFTLWFGKVSDLVSGIDDVAYASIPNTIQYIDHKWYLEYIHHSNDSNSNKS